MLQGQNSGVAIMVVSTVVVVPRWLQGRVGAEARHCRGVQAGEGYRKNEDMVYRESRQERQASPMAHVLVRPDP